MSKKLQGNGLFESSRMILPEHKSAILKSNQEIKRVSKPILHEDEIEDFNRRLNESYNNKESVRIEIYGEWGKREIVGVVSQISSYQNKIKLDFEDGFEWVDFAEILNVRLE